MNADASGPRVRRRVIYSGRVQGVCFRMTAVEAARRAGVRGFVRNLPNGTVELEAEGTRGAVDALLAAVERQLQGNIREATVSELPLRADERGFEIRY